MSIYKKGRDELPSDHGVTDPTSQRKAQPANIALPQTKRWFESLPAHVKPYALLARYPRIANSLAANRNEPKSLRQCFDELLIDRRDYREGLPEDVMRDLLALRTYFNDLYPDVITSWQTMRKRD